MLVFLLFVSRKTLTPLCQATDKIEYNQPRYSATHENLWKENPIM